MKRVAVLLCLVMVLVFAVACTPQVESMENMIGTQISLRIEGRDAEQAEKDIYAMIGEVDALVSTSNEKSLISRINNAKVDEIIELDEVTNAIIDATYMYYKVTHGAFDISIFPLVETWKFAPNNMTELSKEPPTADEIARAMTLVGFDKAFKYDNEKATITKKIAGAKLDLGAVAKGYIADRAKRILDGYRIKRAIIDIGRTLYLYGDKTYTVGIAHPRPEMGEDIIKTMECRDIAVSTSGDYERYYKDSKTGERYHHILDPKTGRPVKNGIVSVTVECKNAMVADILSTSVFVLGEKDSIELLERVDSVSHVTIVTEKDGKLTTKVLTKGVEI